MNEQDEGMMKGIIVEKVNDNQVCLVVPDKNSTLKFSDDIDADIFANKAVEVEMPTLYETASLLCAAWQNPDMSYSKLFLNRLKTYPYGQGGFWAPYGIRYIPNEGAYIEERPFILKSDGYRPGHLVRDRISVSRTSNFVPYNLIKSGEKESYSALAKDPLVIALAGEEGADKLAQLASYYKHMPRVEPISESDAVIYINRAPESSLIVAVGLFLPCVLRDGIDKIYSPLIESKGLTISCNSQEGSRFAIGRYKSPKIAS